MENIAIRRKRKKVFRLSRAKLTKTRSRRDAVLLCRKIYPELEKQDPHFWKIHMVHHIDKNPFNNDPNNLAIVLKNDHSLWHRKKYDWEDKFCPRCKKETVHLNNRCTSCRYRHKNIKG